MNQDLKIFQEILVYVLVPKFSFLLKFEYYIYFCILEKTKKWENKKRRKEKI